MNSFQIAEILLEMALLIELTDPNPKKSFAYRRAALSNLKTGVGPVISKIIQSLKSKGKSRYYEDLKKKVPISLLELVNVPGLNVLKVRKLYEKTGIATFEELKIAIANPKFKLLPPFMIRNIQKGIERVEHEGFMLSYSVAYHLAIRYAKSLHGKVAIAGELRRKCEIIHQLNFVTTSSENFTQYPAVKEILSPTLVRLKNGIFAKMTVVPPKNFATAVFLDTGSKAHVEKVWNHQVFTSEKRFYSSIKMQYIPPELREDYGEIEAARAGKLPKLIEENDLKGAFHCHTTDSDGIHSVQEMAEAARKLKWSYIGISDHSKSCKIANGMSEEKLLAQVELIHALNKKYRNFQIFSGVECDILKDGTLDFSNDILKELDFVIVSVHRYFGLEKREMTARILKAVENPYTTIMGHLTGRLLRHRAAYELDVDKIIDACIANKKVIELNCTPSRLDMDWRYWAKAKDRGLLCSINPDAHSIEELNYLPYGINMARKGWLEKKDVINTKTLQQMRRQLGWKAPR